MNNNMNTMNNNNMNVMNNNMNAMNNYNMNNMNNNINNMNMGINMGMYMNDYSMQNELLKCVMEGMGEKPFDNMNDNYNFIMNYVPKIDPSIISEYYGTGKTIIIKFSETSGNTQLLKIGEDANLKNTLKEIAKLIGIRNENEINKLSFLVNGNKININEANGTLKQNNLKNDSSIVIAKYDNNNNN